MASGYLGPPLTIADCKRLGMSGFRVRCTAPYCYNTKLVGFDALELPEGVIFRDIQKVRAFVCEKCGSREVNVSGDWAGTMLADGKR